MLSCWCSYTCTCSNLCHRTRTTDMCWAVFHCTVMKNRAPVKSTVKMEIKTQTSAHESEYTSTLERLQLNLTPVLAMPLESPHTPATESGMDMVSGPNNIPQRTHVFLSTTYDWHTHVYVSDEHAKNTWYEKYTHVNHNLPPRTYSGRSCEYGGTYRQW